ncbi:MAG: hypothetical protein J7K34_07200 [Flavobacteriaceae bacterium]|nr:hypothetical protein [Flavobacteriaceae bacterium]
MKTFLKILIILLIGVSFSSCDDIESLADFDFNSNLGADLNVVVPATGAMKATVKIGGISFSEEEIIDPLADSQIKKYLDNLKSFDVQEITGTVKRVSKPVTIVSGNITISQGSKSASWSVTNFDVVNGAKIILDSGEGQWATVNQILKSKGKFTAKIVGTVDNSDVSFTIYILIKVKVVANPLQ